MCNVESCILIKQHAYIIHKIHYILVVLLHIQLEVYGKCVIAIHILI